MKLHFLLLFLFIGCSDTEQGIILKYKRVDELIFKIDDTLIPNKIKVNSMDVVFKDLKAFNYDKEVQKRVFKVANRYYNLGEFEKYKDVINFSLLKSRLKNDSISEAKSLLYLGDYHHITVRSDSAVYYYKNARKIYESKKLYKEVGDVLLQMAYVKTRENDWVSGERHSLEALRYYNFTNEIENAAAVYDLLGYISGNMGDYEEAVKLFEKGLELLSKVESSPFLNYRERLTFNLAVGKSEIGRSEEALSMCKKLLSDRTLIHETPTLYAAILSKHTELNFKIRSSVKNGEVNYRRAIYILDSLNYPESSIPTRVKLSEFLLAKNDTLKGLVIAGEAYNLSKSHKDKTLQTLSLQQLIFADPKNASKYSKEYIALNDSLQIAERQMQNKFARIEFETDQMKIERDNAIFDNSIFLTLFLIFSILISGVLYFAYKRTGWSQARDFKFRQKLDSEIFYLVSQQQQKVMEGRQYEKARISRELHDGVLNDLSFVRNSLAYVIGKGEFASTFNGFQKYLDRLQLIEREIHTISHDLKGKTILHGHSFRKIVDELFEHQHTTTPIEWTFSHDETIRWKYVNSQLKINIYRILQELIQNVNRHSYAKYATVNILRINDKIEITVFDDGRGFTSKNQNTGTGLNNMRERMLLNGGSISVESGYKMGVKIILEFPY